MSTNAKICLQKSLLFVIFISFDSIGLYEHPEVFPAGRTVPCRENFARTRKRTGSGANQKTFSEARSGVKFTKNISSTCTNSVDKPARGEPPRTPDHDRRRAQGLRAESERRHPVFRLRRDRTGRTSPACRSRRSYVANLITQQAPTGSLRWTSNTAPKNTDGRRGNNRKNSLVYCGGGGPILMTRSRLACVIEFAQLRRDDTRWLVLRSCLGNRKYGMTAFTFRAQRPCARRSIMIRSLRGGFLRGRCLSLKM